MRSIVKAVLAKALLGAVLCASVARAQHGDSAAAEQLFTAGREAFERGDYATACPKFEESQRLDPAAGTLINLAACYEKVGRLASAWEAWRTALRQLAPGDERRPTVERMAAAMEKRVPRLRLELAPGAPPGTRVARDAVDLGAASLGVALPVDPGRHLVVVTAPDHLERRYDVEVPEGQTTKLAVAAGEKRLPAPPPAVAPGPKKAPDAEAPADRTESSGSTRTLGFVVAGAGALGVAVGSVTGILALKKKSDMLDDCEKVGDRYQCGSSGLDAADSGRTLATVSTVAFAVGAVGIAGGVWLILSSNGHSTTALTARPTASGATFGVVGRY